MLRGKSLPSFSPHELECLPVSLSSATGMFEYSGQEVKNTLPHLYSFAIWCYQFPKHLPVMQEFKRKKLSCL